MKKILLVFGTRPEAIKMAPVVKQLVLSGGLDVQVCITAQHREMLDQVLSLFKIKPDYDLNIMKPGQNLTDIVTTSLKGVGTVISKVSPDVVVVHGDTSTTFSASLAAFYQKIPVAHVEAGLRTGNKYSPWPEEMNRKLTSAIASLHFAPTQLAKENLLNEGIEPARVFVTGNTVIDSLLEASKTIEDDKVLRKSLEKEFAFLNRGKRLLLVTGHRRENFGEGFENICQAIKHLSDREDVQILYPVHLNPKVQEPVNRILGNNKRVFLIEPVPYFQFVYLMKRSYLILTDSGGVQEEAPSLGKPVLVTRNTTERPEGIEAGTVKLVGRSTDRIIRESEMLLDTPAAYYKISSAHNPYGDGLASERIAKILSMEEAGSDEIDV